VTCIGFERVGNEPDGMNGKRVPDEYRHRDPDHMPGPSMPAEANRTMYMPVEHMPTGREQAEAQALQENMPQGYMGMPQGQPNHSFPPRSMGPADFFPCQFPGYQPPAESPYSVPYQRLPTIDPSQRPEMIYSDQSGYPANVHNSLYLP